MSNVVEVVNGIIDLIKKNIINKTNITVDVNIGDVDVKVTNSFHFNAGDEVILIDYDYNREGTPHYQIYEYARIKEIIDTYTIRLETPVLSTWLVSNSAFVQKTIGHSPLYEEKIYYGDRDVIPSEDMAVCVEPVSLSNEWIYIMGGLSVEYRMSIIIYGKDVETEEGMIILNKYADAIYNLFNTNLHIDINNYDSPLLSNVAAGSYSVIVEDNATNRTNFVPSSTIPDDEIYEVQDNDNIEIDLYCTDVHYNTPSAGKMTVDLSRNDPVLYGAEPLQHSYNILEFAVFRKHGRYFYDSRIDNTEYGTVQKGSAFIRAARLNWFGKEVEEYQFPQRSKGVDEFENIALSSSSSGD